MVFSRGGLKELRSVFKVNWPSFRKRKIERDGNLWVIATTRFQHICYLYSNVGRLFCTPVPPKIYEKACCGFFFQLRELISTKITFIIHFMTAPSIFLVHCTKKVKKLTVENFHFPHLILFGLTFKEPALENTYYLKKEVGRWFVLTLTGHH